MEELKVKVGDKVLYRLWTFSGTVERIETVTRVTPTGRIRIDGSGSQFDKLAVKWVVIHGEVAHIYQSRQMKIASVLKKMLLFQRLCH